MRKVVKRLFCPKNSTKTLVSVRDYEVEECLAKNEPMHIVFGDDTMTLDPHSLISKLSGKSNLIKNTLEKGGKDYCLMNFPWEPNVYADDNGN
jgi:rRNA pseudouridine-1189 N-methylase Emg1 (Nep1/Mra1 family)